MNDSTVNIADFRCRVMKPRASCELFPISGKPGSLTLVQSPRHVGRSSSLSSATISDDPRIYDIGIAREVQRMRPRVIFRPIPIQRRAKVLRFNETPVHARQAVQHWGPEINGPYDLPPAA